MSDLKEKKFGYVVHPPPPPKFNVPPPPPGISTADWISYINSYIDVRARQLYDKLKNLGIIGVSNVTYTRTSDVEDGKTVGTLKVDNQNTEVKIPKIRFSALPETEFTNPKRVFTFRGINNGEDVSIFCENPNLRTTVFDNIFLKDKETQETYMLYMEDGVLKSNKCIIPE